MRVMSNVKAYCRKMIHAAIVMFVAIGASIAHGEKSETRSAILPESEFVFPTTGVRVSGEAMLLAIDDVSLPWKRNLCYYLSKPEVRAEPVLRPSPNENAPDQLTTHFYGSVLYDQGKFRMWYYASHRISRKKNSLGPVCYAESDDGVNWRKPSLGQVEIKGSKDNNAIALPGKELSGVNVIKDEQDPDPNRRYKMIYQAESPAAWTIHPAVSADGIHWTPLPLPKNDDFHEQCSLYQFNGYYFMGFHQPVFGEGGRGRARQGYTWISPDFDHWITELAEAFLLPEPLDNRVGDRMGAWKNKYDQVHLGVGAASFGNVVVGLFGLWHENGWGAGGTTCDLNLVVSNDGIQFREPVKGFVYLSHEDSPVLHAPDTNMPTILCQSGSGILNHGDKTYIYHGRWANYDPKSGDEYAEVGLATLPRDRWGALGLVPKQTEGSVWSAPFTLPSNGCRVILNAEGAEGMRVELSDERFNLLPQYSDKNSGTTKTANGLECPITWPSGDLKSLGGKTVRLRVHLKKSSELEPRLFAVYLRTEKNNWLLRSHPPTASNNF